MLNDDGDTKDQRSIKNIVYKEVFPNVWPRLIERGKVFL